MEKFQVMVKDSDMISAKSLLHLLSTSIDNMKKQVSENKELTADNKLAIYGAVEALTDLHNLVLEQLKDIRTDEKFDGNDGHGGKFDA
jgi:hypothetical protein